MKKSFKSPTGDQISDRKIMEMLGLTTPIDKCPRGPESHLESHDHQDHITLTLACWCWSCPVCFEKKLAFIGKHYASHILAKGGSWGISESKNWTAERKRLFRKSEDWVRITGRHGSVVISNEAFGDMGLNVSDEEIIIHLGAALRDIVYPVGVARFQPVQASDSWGMFRRVPKRKMRMVGPVGPKEDVLEVLEAFQVETRQAFDPDITAAWKTPKGVSDEHAESINAELGKTRRKSKSSKGI